MKWVDLGTREKEKKKLKVYTATSRREGDDDGQNVMCGRLAAAKKKGSALLLFVKSS